MKILPAILTVVVLLTVAVVTNQWTKQDETISVGAPQPSIVEEVIAIENKQKTFVDVANQRTKPDTVKVKTLAIARALLPGTYQRDNYTIEITKVEETEGGIQIFVKASDLNGNPIGFGQDGTIETERFIVYNPPVLVPSGTYTEIFVPELETTVRRNNHREDPAEAILQVIEHNISIVGKDGANIIAGTVGNTTSTFYPEEDPETTAGDGYLTDNNNSTFSDCRNGTTAVSADMSTTLLVSGGRQQTSSDFDCWRAYMAWDTSTIGSDSVSAVTVSVYYNGGGTWDTQSGDIDLVNGSMADPTTLAVGDWDSVTFTALSSIDVTSVSSSAYYDFTGDTASVNGSGVTQFVLMDSNQTDNSSYSLNAVGSRVIWESAESDGAGATTDPKLVVEHAAAGGGGGVVRQSLYWF